MQGANGANNGLQGGSVSPPKNIDEIRTQRTQGEASIMPPLSQGETKPFLSVPNCTEL